MKRLKLFDENGSVEKKFKRQPCLFNKILRDSLILLFRKIKILKMSWYLIPAGLVIKNYSSY